MSNKREQRLKRKRRVRKNVFGTSERPRVSVFRSNKYIYAQVIDDEKRLTLASASDTKLKETGKKTKKEVAAVVGKNLGTVLKKKKISKVVFDRGGYQYHGRVKALAEGIREQGIDF